MNETEAWLVLLHAPQLGPATYQSLLQCFKNPLQVLEASSTQLKASGLKKNTIAYLQRADTQQIQADLEWLSADTHHIITLHDERYPALLATIHDPPPVLFVRGDPDYLQQPQLAMVGSRNPTAAGKKTAYEFARHLSNSGITITSGLAEGIDGACHQGALGCLAGTIALVAHGLDIVYPASHQKLAEEIIQSGAVVSEMPIGTKPHRGLFPKRNRIISGLSLGTLVVEAALKSGSLITARQALEQGREIFAIPGSIHNPLAKGCHQLIRQGAKLVETAEDILEELATHVQPLNTPTRTQPNTTNNKQALDPDHQKLLKCLAYDPMPIDEIVINSGFSAAEVASMLLILELKGSVVSTNGRYTKVQ